MILLILSTINTFSIQESMKNIAKLLSGQVSSYPQSANGSTYYSKKSIDYTCLEIDLRQTAEQIKNQIRAFTFPEYQVPKVLDCYVNAADISSKKSTEKPGTLIQSGLDTISIATVDYDLTLYLDMNNELLNAAATDDVESVSLYYKVQTLNIEMERDGPL